MRLFIGFWVYIIDNIFARTSFILLKSLKYKRSDYLNNHSKISKTHNAFQKMILNRKRWFRALLRGQSIKAKMAQTFLAFGFSIVLLLAAFAWYFYQGNRLNTLIQKLHDIESNLLKAERVERDFFIYETRNLDFFIKGKSIFLDQRKKFFKDIRQDLGTLQNYKEIQVENVKQESQQLINHLSALDQSFDRLVSFTRKRGFKDIGLEGKMRQLIHKIEEDSSALDLGKILTIRRYEKDFIIRKDTQYLAKAKIALRDLESYIQESLNISSEKKGNLLKQLNLYENTFEELVETEKQIGLEANQGLKGNIRTLSILVDKDMERLSQKVISKARAVQSNLQLLMYVLLLLAFILVISMGLYIARQLGEPISRLSQTIYQIIELDFKEGIEIPQIETRNEIGRLARDVKVMYEKLLTHNQEIEVQSQEISQQRDLLVRQNHDILEAQEEIRQVNEKLWNWKDELEKRVEERTEELQKTNDELDFFLYRASHDLKGPVASLKGLIQLAELEVENKTNKLFLQRFDDNVHQLNRLLDKFLMIFEVHHDELLIQNINLKDIWQNSFEQLTAWHNFSPNLFQIQWEGNEICATDATMLEIILLNLAENALLFGRNYPCTIIITALPNELILYFKDRGEGIPPEFLPNRIFEMFFRGSEKSAGNGLGLYIVQKAVEKLGGTINLESILHKQTIFSIAIPLSPFKE